MDLCHWKRRVSLGYNCVDALFSPVQKVAHNVTNARVGQNTDFDNWP